MTPSWLGHHRFRFDSAHTNMNSSNPESPVAGASAETAPDRFTSFDRLHAAIRRTRNFLLDHQNADGYWCAELEGDTILESEYILLLTYLGRGQSEIAQACARYILQQQLPTGGWAMYPGGALEISGSVKAYWALKITGHSPELPEMVRAKNAILAAGGAEKVNSFTRYYMALLGILRYDQCPAVPPELILLPSWAPMNVYEMSAWSRTIVIPLSLLWAFKPNTKLPAEHQIDELFLDSPQRLPMTMGPSAVLDKLKKKSWVPWSTLFRGIDRILKFGESLRLLPLRKRALRLAEEWIIARFAGSDGLGAIFPPIVWSVIGLKCLGHDVDSPLVKSQLDELERLTIREGDTARLQPCKSPVWDTAIATIALSDAGVPHTHPAMQRSINWLLEKEIREAGDWAVRNRSTVPSGWAFEFQNCFYPDNDDTVMVLMALARGLGNRKDWKLECQFTMPGESAFESTGISAQATVAAPTASAMVSGRTGNSAAAISMLESQRPILEALQRGSAWVIAMQNRDGGWGAFDKDNDREFLTRVPFADHNAMIDPSTADLTARAVEMFGVLGMSQSHPVAERALRFVFAEQESDHCWIGRWGVNYIYGTWQALQGLQAIGFPMSDPRVRKAVAWFKTAQQRNGGWGESANSYEFPHLRGQGPTTASQTAWALLGLVAAGEANSTAVDDGVRYLLDTQRDDGNWDEPEFTGTGFPKVFYLRYHYYRTYFPLMALARVAAARSPAATQQTVSFEVAE